MAAVVMVASSSGNRRRMAPKPPATGNKPLPLGLLGPQPSLPSPLSPRETAQPELSRQKETESAGTRAENSTLRCVNETLSTEEFRNPSHGTATVNIDGVRRRGRRTKAPKPLPYLEPIATYLSRGGDGSEQRRKKVTFAAPSSAGRRYRVRQHRAVARANSEKLSRRQRRDLAYLVVDLQSGTIASSFEELWETKGGQSVGRGATLQRSLTLADPLTRERAMSTGADSKPVPLPRRKPSTATSPAANDCDTPQPLESDAVEKPTSPPLAPKPPARRHTPEREQDPTSPERKLCTQSSSGHLGSNLVSLRTQAIEQSSRPISESPATYTGQFPLPRKRIQSTSTDSHPKPVVVSPPSPTPPALPPKSPPHQPSPTPPALPPKSPPHQPVAPSGGCSKPPALPAKSELSRQIQSSVNKPKREPPPPPPAQPYETAIPLHVFDTHQNDSYGAHTTDDSTGAHTTDDSTGDYEVSDPEDSRFQPDLEEDRPEDVYIDPTESKQFSSTGKPKPPRPPPPSTSAIKKAQQKKRQQQIAATLKPPSTTGKRLTKKHSNPTTHTMSTGRRNKARGTQNSHSPSPRPKSPESGDQLYEDLDLGRPSPSTSILWRPPSVSPRVSPSPGPTPAEPPAPSLPPRSTKPTSRTLRRQLGGSKKVSSGGFTRSKSIGDLDSTDESKQVGSSNTGKEDSGATDEDDEDCVYEPVEIGAPLAPQRTKRHIKGTQISPHRTPGNVYKSHTRTNTTRNVGKLGQQRLGKRPAVSPPKTPKSDLGTKEEINLSDLALQDEGGVEEYVDMDYRETWTEAKQEDGPEVYVDMQPANKMEHEETSETPSLLRPYLRI